jgi:hypothetical protein
MFAAVCFFLLVILSLRSFVLMIAESKPLPIRLLDFVLALCFGASALSLLVFLGQRFPENRGRLGLLFVFLALPASLLLIQRLRKPYSPRPVLFLSKTILVLLLLCASLIGLMISGFLFLSEDQPVLKITMTGSGRQETVEWKPPDGVPQKQELRAHEVQFETPDGRPVAQLFVYGDQVAVKAKVIRFRPVLNAMGVRNLCRLEYAHNGYITPERFNLFPHRSQAIQVTDPRLEPVQAWFWKYWEDLYYQEQENWWVKSATLESGYFPLTYANGAPFRGAYYLTVTPGGLSSVPLPQPNKKL